MACDLCGKTGKRQWSGALGFFNVPWPLPATPSARTAPDLWSDQ
ncbi:hypothetical protein BH11PSE13_BH11PSE13_12560 [soil metagenome]